MDFEIKIFYESSFSHFMFIICLKVLLYIYKFYCEFLLIFTVTKKKKDDIFTIPKEQNKFIYLSVCFFFIMNINTHL